jgi:hypothetical protein
MSEPDHTDFELRRLRHKPSDPEAIAREIIRLHKNGMSTESIARCLAADEVWVIQIVAKEAL